MKQFLKPITVFILLSYVFVGCNNEDKPGTDPSLKTSTAGIPKAPVLNYSIVAQYPHDAEAYTQGLQLYKGKLYEGTGDYENSSLRVADLTTGKVLEKHMMGSAQVFGEGITILNDTLYQLTWTTNKVFVYTLDNLAKPFKIMDWPNEGWGITNNGKDLIISDGSAILYFVDPKTFKIQNTVRVADQSGVINNLNELEYINGHVYANVFMTNNIVKIDPESGHVKGILSFDNILSSQEKTFRTDVFNGIAWDSAKNTLLVTGKRWPKVFEVKIQE